MIFMLPYHIAIIPDGNRRWAKGKGLDTLEGHREGIENMKRALKWCRNFGIRMISLWGFSTENKGRSEREVRYLFELFEKKLAEGEKEGDYAKHKIRVRFYGKKEMFPKKVREMMADVEGKTKRNSKYFLNLFFGYGGRQEIVDAVNKAVSQGKRVDERSFAKLLYTSDLPDPDLVIRTSGEERTSGFLPYQAVYSELYFSKKFWPEFDRREFKRALQEYARRKRRFGK
ncbi:di-trans,poly-cis-decaprenylcistransferase [Candidatus Micrarchaeota archaeon CG11_big_fil_rev_8_21_14_0_20_47_5]|nr:MAG: di-trans,poly-cis-decaprenylcistransferase [Candidatus Micrarchaeota archaeon CG11_big_fil_rev_8_21_14_0_20_47_5]